MPVEKPLLLKAKDKTAITFVVLNLLFGIWICLDTTGTALNSDVQTLWLVSLTCTLLSLNRFNRKEDIQWSSLAIIPIALRSLLTYEIFTSWNKMFEDLYVALYVIGVWIIVATSEETFRATMTNVAQLKIKKPIIQDIIAVACWLVFHFVQRSFNLLYCIWLIVAGFVLQYIMRKGGLGASILAHVVINLTA